MSGYALAPFSGTIMVHGIIPTSRISKMKSTSPHGDGHFKASLRECSAPVVEPKEHIIHRRIGEEAARHALLTGSTLLDIVSTVKAHADTVGCIGTSEQKAEVHAVHSKRILLEWIGLGLSDGGPGGKEHNNKSEETNHLE